jgi:hypothetical protein
MREGFEITFREMLPDSGIVELVVQLLASVPRAADQRCSVVLRRLSAWPNCFGAHVELGSGRRMAVHVEGAGEDAGGAVRSAFANLRQRLVVEARRSAREPSLVQ